MSDIPNEIRIRLKQLYPDPDPGIWDWDEGQWDWELSLANFKNLAAVGTREGTRSDQAKLNSNGTAKNFHSFRQRLDSSPSDC